MDWVEGFYTLQYALLADDVAWQVQPHHCEIAASVRTLAGPPPGRVLELGAGGGQVAAALADLGYDVLANELLPEVAARATALARSSRAGTMTVLAGSFYDIELPDTFDAVCYWMALASVATPTSERYCGWCGPGSRQPGRR
ncbi:MAG: methyltransferase domain-containing protein [Thermomicrobiales bacterium]|nr:methyltransferase domain-containing protein [Thermomicrobiales bacterium]